MASPARPLAVLALLCVVGVSLYSPAYDAPFHFDDHHSIRQNPHLSDLAALPGFFSDPTRFSGESAKAMYRPVLLASYTLTRAVAGASGWVAGLHIGNVLLHVAVSWMVWALVGVASTQQTGSRWALAAGLAFLLHPLASETALYISARSESLSTLFMLSTLLLWLRGTLWGALICFLLALGCKSTAIVTPLLLLGVERLMGTNDLKSSLKRLTPFLLIASAYMIWMRGLIQTSLVEQHVRSSAEQILVQLHAWVYQLLLLIMAHPASVIHPVDTAPASGSHLAAVLLGTTILWQLAPRARLAWGIGVVALPLVIPSVIPLHTVVSEHRLYPTLALAAIMAGGTLSSVVSIRARSRATWCMVALLVIWGLLTAGNTRTWSHEIALWQNARDVAPNSARTHEFLGDALRRDGQLKEALASLQRADDLYGGRLETQLSIMGILLQENQLDAAYDIGASLISQYPEEPGVLYNLALSLRLADAGRAVELLERTLVQRPDWLEAVMERALLQQQLGQGDAAAASLEETLQAHPHWLQGWVNLGFIHARQGNLISARIAWERADSLSPGNATIMENLAELDRIELPRSGR